MCFSFNLGWHSIQIDIDHSEHRGGVILLNGQKLLDKSYLSTISNFGNANTCLGTVDK